MLYESYILQSCNTLHVRFMSTVNKGKPRTSEDQSRINTVCYVGWLKAVLMSYVDY